MIKPHLTEQQTKAMQVIGTQIGQRGTASEKRAWETLNELIKGVSYPPNEDEVVKLKLCREIVMMIDDAIELPEASHWRVKALMQDSHEEIKMVHAIHLFNIKKENAC